MATDFGAGEQVRVFTEGIRDQLHQHWGVATAAGGELTNSLSKLAASQGWYELGAHEAIPFAVGTMYELGAVACPLPIHDAFVSIELAPDHIKEKIADGTIVPLIAVNYKPQNLFSGASIATHIFDIDPISLTVSMRNIQRVMLADGLARPAWSRVIVDDGEQWTVDSESISGAMTLYRFFIACRMLGAAERAHHLAIEHAKNRKQFGRVIGSYGAVQQRIAECEITVEASHALVEEAVRQFENPEARDRLLHLLLATQFVREHAVSTVHGAQHTLGAIGYFEEHEVPWLFREVHADSLLIDAGESAVDSIVELMIAGEESLPDFSIDSGSLAVRQEIRNLLSAHRTGPGASEYRLEELRLAAAESGIFSLGWPEEFGGRRASPITLATVAEEMKRAGGPVDRAMSAAAMLGHSIIQFGTPEQQEQVLPVIQRGELAFCLGYSEPDAGSDLASLKTSATVEGSEWVINGQKLWTTRAHTASHVWLAVRTDFQAKPRHAGITIFLIPMDTPGITISEHTALSGEISCTVFYDNVRVPDSMRVGEVNGGWQVITDALASERLIMGGVAGTLLRQLDMALQKIRAHPEISGTRNSAITYRINSLAAKLQAARALVLRASRSESMAEVRRISPMAAVFSGDLAEEITTSLLDIFGVQGAVGSAPDQSLNVEQGELEGILRLAPMYVIGGGTNDIQRALIARSLGLPRE